MPTSDRISSLRSCMHGDRRCCRVSRRGFTISFIARPRKSPFCTDSGDSWKGWQQALRLAQEPNGGSPGNRLAAAALMGLFYRDEHVLISEP